MSMLFAVLIGGVLNMIVGGTLVGALVAGVVAGYIAGGGASRGALAGFLSGILGGLLLFTVIVVAGFALKPLVGPLGPIMGLGLGMAVLLWSAINGIISALGGAIGGYLRKA